MLSSHLSEEKQEISKTMLHKIILEEVICKKNPEDKDYVFTSNDSKWIFDFRKAFLKPYFLDIFAKFFWEEMGDLYPFQIG
jgi:hypothetical protein